MPFLLKVQGRRSNCYLPVGPLIGVVAALTSCCGSWTEVTTLTYFPTNATQHTEYTLQVAAHGEAGKAYNDFGPKRVFVTVFHNGTPYVESKPCKIEAAHLKWEVSWDEFSSPHIRFFEEGETNKTIQIISLKIAAAPHS